MSNNIFYAEDAVCFLDTDKKLAYIGDVVKSDKLVPTFSIYEGDEAEQETGNVSNPHSSTITQGNDIETAPIDPKDSDSRNPAPPMIEVSWTSLKNGDEYTFSKSPIPTSLRADQLVLLERSHIIGDVIRHAVTEKVGTVVNQQIRACAEILNYGRLLFDVDCSRLRSVYPWSGRTNENHVIWRGWLGRVVACHMLAIVRFSDGARLLVREECLHNFDTISPTTEAFPDPYFEGAWLKGDAYDFKINPDLSRFTSFTDLLFSSSNRVWSLSNRGQLHDKNSNNQPETSTDPTNDSSPVDEPEDSTKLTSEGVDVHATPNQTPEMETQILPPGHPLKLLRELAQSAVTRGLMTKQDQLSKLLECTPIFLTETTMRNATWLSKLRSSQNVTVYVEHLIPAEATVHWFANRNPAKTSPPASIVRGEDLVNLQSVMPYPYLSCAARDIWYIQLQPTDAMYNAKLHDCPERLIYDRFTGDKEGLEVARMEFDEPVTQTAVSENLDSSVCSSATALQPKAGHSEVRVQSSKTTPFWTQRTLLSSGHRRTRIVANPKRRLTHSDMVSWANEQHPYDVFMSTNDTESDDSGNELPPGDGGRNRKSVKRRGSKRGVTATPDGAAEAGKNKLKSPAKSHALTDTPSDPVTVDSKADTKKLGQSILSNTAGSVGHTKWTKATREAHNPPLVPGAWTAIGLHATRTTYDVRWQDGTLECGITCGNLLPVYFNIDEHDFFPGSLVSLKSLMKTSDTTETKEDESKSGDNTVDVVVPDGGDSNDPTDYPRNHGIVLNNNPKDRTCLIQWFRTVKSPEKDIETLEPCGQPEEAGVYELSSSPERQINYGDVVLMFNLSDKAHANIPAGYVEDVIPESGKLLVHLIDGTKTTISRSECLFTLDALMDDDDFSNDDSSEMETSELTSDSESDWETVSEDDMPADWDEYENKLADAEDALKTDASAAVVKVENVTPDESVSKAGELVVNAYRCTEAASQLFSDRRTFVFWLLRRFVAVPDQLDSAVDQLGTLLAAAAVSPTPMSLLNESHKPLNRLPSLVGSQSTLVTFPITTTPEQPEGEWLETESTKVNGANVSEKTPKPTVIVGELLSPAAAWDYAEEREAIEVADKLHSVRELMHQAYQLVRDYRIKKLYTKCDHRELFSEKHVEGILKSIEINRQVNSDTEVELPNVEFHAFEASTEDLAGIPEVTKLHTIIPGQETLSPEILVAMRLSRMKVLLVPEYSKPFTSCDENWRNRIHYSMAKPETDGSHEGEEPTAYMIVSTTLFSQLTRYVTRVHQHLLEQLTDFGQHALAWLGEMAPEMHARALHGDLEAVADDEEIATAAAVGEEAGQSTEKSDAQPDARNGDPLEDRPAVLNDANADTSATALGASSLTRQDSQPGIVVDAIPAEYRGEFIVEDTAPSTHRFCKTSPENLPKAFYKAWKRDVTLLSTSLPRGIIVKAFSDRMDLYSLLIVGSAGTPYEHGLFLFDILLPPRYPSVPPQVHYYSFASERVNPNLYVEGHVCLSLLGTWTGKDSENWSPVNSNLLQLVVSLQGLILNSEPYFNEAGFDACRGTADAPERSRVYNESVVVTLVQSMVSLVQNPVPVFRQAIMQHCQTFSDAYASMVEFWSTLDETEFKRLKAAAALSKEPSEPGKYLLPEFPLAPVSKGFQISVRRHRLTFLRLVEASKKSVS